MEKLFIEPFIRELDYECKCINAFKKLLKNDNMVGNKPKNSLYSIVKLEIFQETFASSIGCLLFIILFFFFPKHMYFSADSTKNFTAKLTLSIIVSSFFLVFIFLNQSNAAKDFFKVNYNRNIVLFSIFTFVTYSFLFFNTNFGFYELIDNNWLNSAYLNVLNGEPFKFFRYYFLFFYFLIPIILYESWKKIYSKKIAFTISTASIVFLLDPFFIDHMVGVLFIIPYFLYYFENIKKIEFTKKNYVIAGLLGSFIFCSFSACFLFIPIYFIIKLFQNKREFKDNFKRISLISIFIISFSSWFWAQIIINIFILKPEVRPKSFFFREYMDLVPFVTDIYPFTYFGFTLLCGLIYILKNYSLSQEFRIYGNLLLSNFILFLIIFITIILKVHAIPIRFMRIYMYILIIASSIFYVKFFYFIHNNNFLKKFNIKGNFLQIEISILIVILFTQSYLNLYNIYTSDYYQKALEGEEPDNVISYFNRVDYEEDKFLPNLFEFNLLKSTFSTIIKFIQFSQLSLSFLDPFNSKFDYILA